jgi:hypothetical protein
MVWYMNDEERDERGRLRVKEGRRRRKMKKNREEPQEQILEPKTQRDKK